MVYEDHQFRYSKSVTRCSDVIESVSVNTIVNNFTPVRLLANYISKFHYSGNGMQISVNYFADPSGLAV